VARAGMGVDAADYDHTGVASILITNFANQMLSLYHNEGKGLFVDEAPRSEIGRASLLTLGFGCFFFDFDLDGWPDIFIANGHIDADVQRVQPNVKYAMPPHLFRNVGKGNFVEVTKNMGATFATARVGRGAAYGDINNDGRLDLLLSTNGGPVYLFENDAAAGSAVNKSLRVKLAGTKSNRDGIGAVVKVTAGGELQSQMMRSGSSYLSASELVLTFGFGQREQAETVEIRWPSGQVEKLSNVSAGQTITVTEGKGVTGSRKFGTR
jgi:enediyne biosynthesis protein E4